MVAPPTPKWWGNQPAIRGADGDDLRHPGRFWDAPFSKLKLGTAWLSNLEHRNGRPEPTSSYCRKTSTGYTPKSARNIITSKSLSLLCILFGFASTRGQLTRTVANLLIANFVAPLRGKRWPELVGNASLFGFKLFWPFASLNILF